MSPPYSPVVMDHFHHPRSAFRMPDADRVGTAGRPGSGPFVVLYFKLEGACIQAASFQTYGCAPAIAAASLLCERLPGTPVAEAARWTAQEIERELGGLPAHKRVCAELAAAALVAALGPARAPDAE